MIYDAIIIGGGVAGVTAAIYLKMAGLNIAIIEKELIGGKLNYISEINNIPGILSVNPLSLNSVFPSPKSVISNIGFPKNGTTVSLCVWDKFHSFGKLNPLFANSS